MKDKNRQYIAKLKRGIQDAQFASDIRVLRAELRAAVQNQKE